MKTFKLIAIFLAVFAIAAQAEDTYVITGIRSDANGAAVTIQFGSDGSTLNIGTYYIGFF